MPYPSIFTDSHNKAVFSDIKTVKTGKDLLKSHAHYLEELKRLLRFPDDYFQPLCMRLLINSAKYMQQLPAWQTLKTTHKTSLLQRALRRTCYALVLRHNLTFPEDGHPDIVDEQYPLWTYAVFSGALLWRIGTLYNYYTVESSDKNGGVKSSWNPLLGPMQSNQVYRFNQSIGKNHELPEPTTLLAYQLMPKGIELEDDDDGGSGGTDGGLCDGYSWIASDKTVLNFWLSALIDDAGAKGKLEAIIFFADELALKAQELSFDFSQELALLEQRAELLSSKDISLETWIDSLSSNKDDVTIPIEELTSTLEGERFYESIKRSISEGDLNKYNINTLNDVVHNHTHLALSAEILHMLERSFLARYGLDRMPLMFNSLIQKGIGIKTNSSIGTKNPSQFSRVFNPQVKAPLQSSGQFPPKTTPQKKPLHSRMVNIFKPPG